MTADATCTSTGTKTFTCSCGETKTESIPANGHQMTTESSASTCTKAGKTKIYCKVCGYAIGGNGDLTLEHSWDGGTVTQEASCSRGGEINYKCTNCPMEKYEEIPRAECSWGEPNEEGMRTCSVYGSTTYD